MWMRTPSTNISTLGTTMRWLSGEYSAFDDFVGDAVQDQPRTAPAFSGRKDDQIDPVVSS